MSEAPVDYVEYCATRLLTALEGVAGQVDHLGKLGARRMRSVTGLGGPEAVWSVRPLEVLPEGLRPFALLRDSYVKALQPIRRGHGIFDAGDDELASGAYPYDASPSAERTAGHFNAHTVEFFPSPDPTALEFELGISVVAGLDKVGHHRRPVLHFVDRQGLGTPATLHLPHALSDTYLPDEVEITLMRIMRSEGGFAWEVCWFVQPWHPDPVLAIQPYRYEPFWIVTSAGVYDDSAGAPTAAHDQSPRRLRATSRHLEAVC